jgi:uncharacterized protein YecT (DUF1311 family)
MRVFLALLVLFSVSPLCAQNDLPDCASARTTPELNKCAQAEAQQTEAEMMGVFAALMAQLRKGEEFGIQSSTGAPIALENSQRAWLAYKGSQCNFAGASTGGGTGSAAFQLGCMSRLNRERAAELRLFLE